VRFAKIDDEELDIVAIRVEEGFQPTG